MSDSDYPGIEHKAVAVDLTTGLALVKAVQTAANMSGEWRDCAPTANVDEVLVRHARSRDYDEYSYKSFIVSFVTSYDSPPSKCQADEEPSRRANNQEGKLLEFRKRMPDGTTNRRGS